MDGSAGADGLCQRCDGGSILFRLLFDHIILHLHMNAEQAEGPKSTLAKKGEGAIISMRLHAQGRGRSKAFFDGVLSGAVDMPVRWDPKTLDNEVR